MLDSRAKLVKCKGTTYKGEKICCNIEYPHTKNHFSMRSTHKKSRVIGETCLGCVSERNRRYQEDNVKNPDRIRSKRNAELLRTYGVTIEEYEKLLQEQNCLCQLCGKPEVNTFRGEIRALSLDHCHETGKIRGVLCFKCNTKLGIYEEILRNHEFKSKIDNYLNWYEGLIMEETIEEVTIELKDDTIKELSNSGKVTWELCYPLVSKSHSAGDFQLTTRNFEEIVENFKNRSTGRIPICFEHYASLDAKDMNPLLGNPAHGWVTNLFVGVDGSLYGEVELFEPARSYVKEGRYKYMSPAIRFGTRDKLTGQNVGCSIEEVSLTNLPHLEKQKGVWTNSNKNVSNSKNNSDKIISSEYNDKNMDEIEKLKLEITKLTLSLQAKDGEITSLKEANAREVKTLSDKLTAVEEEFKKREQEAAKADVDAAFTAYQKTHSLKDTQKEAMLAFRLSDKKAFEAIYPKVVPQATSEVPAFLTTTLTLNENTATQPQSTVSRSKLSPTQLRDKQAALTSQYTKTQNPDTGENYTMTEAIFKAVADLKKEYE